MEQKEVRNTSEDVVSVLWDGQNVEFLPGQVRVFGASLAEHIANEHASLEVVGDDEPEEAEKGEEEAENVEAEAEEEPQEEVKPAKKAAKKAKK